MPELPEVETTRRGIAPQLVQHRLIELIVHDSRLRWPVPAGLAAELRGQSLQAIERRAKYLLFRWDRGTMIVHLGMSGSLRVLDCPLPLSPHDHVEWRFDHGRCLRLRDPRRFGAVLWTSDPVDRHPLLRGLGPEPLGVECTPEYLYAISRGRKVALRDLLMNARLLAGVGNIYANEACFGAGLRPRRMAGRLRRADCVRLVAALRATLESALRAGGTTLRDFQNADGQPGYFQQTLSVYGRAGQACRRCGTTIKGTRLGQRSTFYCPHCQV